MGPELERSRSSSENVQRAVFNVVVDNSSDNPTKSAEDCPHGNRVRTRDEELRPLVNVIKELTQRRGPALATMLNASANDDSVDAALDESKDAEQEVDPNLTHGDTQQVTLNRGSRCKFNVCPMTSALMPQGV